MTEPAAHRSEESGGLDIRALVRVVLKYKWGIIGLSLLMATLAGLWVFKQVHIYRATAVLLIEREEHGFARHVLDAVRFVPLLNGPLA